MEKPEPTTEELMQAAGVAFMRTMTAILVGVLAFGTVGAVMVWIGRGPFDSLSNTGLAIYMLGAITMMVSLWLGACFAVDKWYWLPRAKQLPSIPTTQAGLFNPLVNLPTPAPMASWRYKTVHGMSVVLIALLAWGAHSAYFLRGISSLFIVPLSLLLYPFAYAGARIFLKRMER